MTKKLAALSLAVILFSCDDSNGIKKQTQVIEPASEHNYIAETLAANTAWLTPTAQAGLQQGWVNLAALDIPAELPLTLEVSAVGQTLDYKLGLEIDARSDQSQFDEFYLALDPDQFQFKSHNGEETQSGMADIMLQAYLISGGTYELIELELTENSTFDRPLIYISMTVEIEIAGKSHPSSAVPGTYVTLVAAELLKKSDYGNEEIELFVSDRNDPIKYPFLKSTSHIFDGRMSSDAAGEFKRYPDINQTGVLYWADEPICLGRLDDIYKAFRIIAVENDNITGVLQGLPSNPEEERVDYFDPELKQILEQKRTKFEMNQLPNTQDDDRLFSSGVIKLNLLYLQDLIAEQNPISSNQVTGQVQLGDVIWYLGMKTVE